MNNRFDPSPASRTARLVLLAALAFAASTSVVAQTSSYANALQNNGARQAILTQQMIDTNAFNAAHAGGSRADPSVPNCMPPYDLMRGTDAHVPVELQGDPRYQAYLRCQQGQPAAQNQRSTQGATGLSGAPHLAISATDFVPSGRGRPAVDQAIANMALTPEQRVHLRKDVDEMFRMVATRYRGNNVAVAVTVAYATATLVTTGADMNDRQIQEMAFNVNDALARNPRFAALSSMQKQNDAEGLLFQAVVMSVLRGLGTSDPQARQQSVELARVVLKQLNGA